MKNIEWTEDRFAELKMRDMSIEWSLVDIPLIKIDEVASAANKARMSSSLMQDLILDYQGEMERGNPFPRIVVEATGSKYFICGGNHRFQAAKASGLTTIGAYSVSIKDENLRQLFPMILNRGHGSRQIRKEAIQHAIFAVETGKTPDWASDAFSIAKGALLKSLMAHRVRKVLESAGVNCGGISETSLNSLNRIKNENVLKAAGRIVSQSDLSGASFNGFLSDIIGAKNTEASQMSVIAQYEDAHERMDPAVASKVCKASSRFMAVLSGLERSTYGKRTLKQIGEFDEDKTAKIKNRLKELAQKLNAIANSKS